MGALTVFAFGSAVFLAGLQLIQMLELRIGKSTGFAAKVTLLFLVAVAALWHTGTVWSLVSVALAAVAAMWMMCRQTLDAAVHLLGPYRLPLFLLSVFGIASLVMVAIPITTFLTSPGEIGIHIDRLLKVNVRDVMVVVYAATVLYLLATHASARAGMAVLTVGAFFLCWVYAFALPFGYPMLTGLAFEQLAQPLQTAVLRGIADLFVVVSVSLVLRKLWQRFGTRAVFGSLVLANFSVVLVAGFSIGRDQVGTAGDNNNAQVSALPLVFSRSHPNTLFIFLDRFMGSHVEAVLESDPALAARLTGFTWYPRTVSAGENSIAGVHPMLGGYDYLPTEINARGKPLRDQSVEAFSILPYNFAAKDYRVHVINPRGLGFTMMGDCSFLDIRGVTCTHIPASVSHRKAQAMGFPVKALAEANYADLLVLLGAMRVAPYAMKDALYAKGPWQPFLDHSAGTTFREWAELHALEAMTRVDDLGPVFNLITNILPHEPYFMGLNCLPRPQRLDLPNEQIKRLGHDNLFALQHANTARCALLEVARYVDFMKKAGIYDNTTIAIASDHGIVGSVHDTSRRAVAGGATANTYVSLRPLVMIKKAGAHGPLQISETFMPNAEVPIALCADIGGCINPYLDNRPVTTMGRDDPFTATLVPWQFSSQKPDAFVIRKQWVLRGKDPFDIKGWSTQP